MVQNPRKIVRTSLFSKSLWEMKILARFWVWKYKTTQWVPTSVLVSLKWLVMVWNTFLISDLYSLQKNKTQLHIFLIAKFSTFLPNLPTKKIPFFFSMSDSKSLRDEFPGAFLSLKLKNDSVTHYLNFGVLKMIGQGVEHISNF